MSKTRIEIRLLSEDKELLEAAAAQLGVSVSQFVRTVALAKAQENITAAWANRKKRN